MNDRTTFTSRSLGVDQLKAKGITFKSEIIPSPVCRMSIIEDSEGNSIVLHQLHKK